MFFVLNFKSNLELVTFQDLDQI